MNQVIKRITSLVLAVSMVLSMSSVNVWATEAEVVSSTVAPAVEMEEDSAFDKEMEVKLNQEFENKEAEETEHWSENEGEEDYMSSSTNEETDAVQTEEIEQSDAGDVAEEVEPIAQDEAKIEQTVEAENSATRPDNITPESMIMPEEYSQTLTNSVIGTNGKNTVLLIQTSYPWDSNTNITLLNKLIKDGYVDNYSVVSMENAVHQSFENYSVVMLANDQSASSYAQYERIRVALEDYVHNGGVVLFGACDNGWAGGQIENTLPGSISKYKDYSNYDYIVDSKHPIVTGTLTDGNRMTDSMLYSTYCSHTSFNKDTLPKETKIILASKNTGDPTLIEYPCGNGWVIASGLTWEYGYERTGDYSKNSYDDLIVYALSLSGANYQKNEYNPTIHSFTYQQNKPHADLARKMALYSLLAYQDSGTNSNGEWVSAKKDDTSKKQLGSILFSEGFEDIYTYNYDTVGTKRGHSVSREYNPTEDSILYTIGHRRVKMVDGDIQDQIIVVFRGTNNAEWYGNFDVSGNSYDSSVVSHKSFQKAVNNTMKSLVAYIQEMEAAGRLNTSALSIVTTGHSRGAATANMFAHEMSDLRDGSISGYGADTHMDSMSKYTIKSVYAYTYATPNVATYQKIKSHTQYDNIFNYCFTDDFVPNLPLESWSWGKYGKTYWATAAVLKKDSKFQNAVKTYFGKKGTYSKSYTESIVSLAAEATTKKKKASLEHYYNIQRWYGGPGATYSLYEFMRLGLGGTMQKKAEGYLLLATCAAGDMTVSPYFKALSQNLVVGGGLIPALDNCHQCFSYYSAMRTEFSRFEYSELKESGYSATKYSIEETEALRFLSGDGEKDPKQLQAMREFLATKTVMEQYGINVTNAELLDWDVEDVSTWDGILWENGNIIAIDISYSGVAGTIDLKAFPKLLSLNCAYDNLTTLDVSGCRNIESLKCDGNQLTNLDMTGLSNLFELNCSNNKLSQLKLKGCRSLESLSCDNNALEVLDLSECTSLLSLSCEYNYLDFSEYNLQKTIDAINSNEDGLADVETQNLSKTAAFSQNDVAVLKKLAGYDNNKSILGWDLNDPASWSGVEWVRKSNAYRLRGVNLTGLKLKGSAAFDNCTELEYVIITDNYFTNLSLNQCSKLETLWCSYNCLSSNTITAAIKDKMNVSLQSDNQRAEADMVLNQKDIRALEQLIKNTGLSWELEEAATQAALIWTKMGNTYRLTGIDFTGSGAVGEADLSGFDKLTHIQAKNSELYSVILPSTITAIEAETFMGSEKLEQVTIPNGYTDIGKQAFKNCVSLKTITLPASIMQIEEGAFLGCSRLYLVNILGKAPSINKNAFGRCRENLTLNLQFDISNVSVDIDQNVALSTQNFPKDEKLTWKTSKEQVAIVNDKGQVKSVGEGTSLITATSSNGFSATCSVIVSSHVHECTYSVGNELTHLMRCNKCGYNRQESHFFVDGACACGAYNETANTITATNITKNASTKEQSIALGAKATGGTLKYTSDNSKITVKDGKAVVPANFTGKANITITASGNGYATATKTIVLTINKVANTITASNFTKTYSTKAQSFSIGATRKGSGALTYTSSSKSVTVDKAGKVTVKAKFMGKVTITIKVAAKGIYKEATKKITVTVNPTKTTLSSVANAKGRKMTVKWKKNTVGTGYEIQFSTSKDFSSGTKSANVTKNATASMTITGLTKGKTYYVRIRTYKTVSSVKYYSGWSAVKSVKISK